MTNMDMSEAIGMIAQEKGITEETLLHVLVDALASAYKRRDDAADEVVVEVNPETMDFSFIAYDVDDDGNWVNERDDTPRKEEMGRIAAMTFRQVMSQRIREVESDRKFEEYANREGDIVTGIIQRTDARYTLLDLGRAEALLPQAEQVPFERPAQGDRQKAYIVEVRRTPKGPQIVVSRTHPGLIKRLFELEVPEIAEGIVEIKACAREPGHRTKIAVWSNDNNVDPVGACVGARGGRVRMVVNEMRGEKIDIVPFSEDLADFVAKALSPAKVTQVIISEDGTAADVIVPDHQLSLAIGREGQNARLSARLTGVRVDIRSETQLAEGIPASHGRDSDVEYAVGEWRPNAETGENEWHSADGSVISESEWNKQVEDAEAKAAADEAAVPEVTEELRPGTWAGSVLPMSDPDQVPPGFEIKANEGSDLYHLPGSRYYDQTKAELWFRSLDAAEGAGFSPAGGSADTSDEDVADVAPADADDAVTTAADDTPEAVADDAPAEVAEVEVEVEAEAAAAEPADEAATDSETSSEADD